MENGEAAELPVLTELLHGGLANVPRTAGPDGEAGTTSLTFRPRQEAAMSRAQSRDAALGTQGSGSHAKQAREAKPREAQPREAKAKAEVKREAKNPANCAEVSEGGEGEGTSDSEPAKRSQAASEERRRNCPSKRSGRSSPARARLGRCAALMAAPAQRRITAKCPESPPRRAAGAAVLVVRVSRAMHEPSTARQRAPHRRRRCRTGGANGHLLI